MNSRCKSMLCVLGLVSFCLTATVASAAEIQLAGIRLGRSALTILDKYGNPTEVRIGATTQTSFSSSANTTGGTLPGGITAIPGAPMVSSGGIPGMIGGGATGGLPMMPGMIGSASASSSSSSTSVSSNTTKSTEVTWVYNLAKGKTLEFIISPDGRIVQVAAYGVDWSSIHTSLGIKIGSTYKDVLRKYGWPEDQDKKGMELEMGYADKHRATFTLLDQTVVGITIALMD